MKTRFAYDGVAAYSAPHSSMAARLGALLAAAMAAPRRWAHRRHGRGDFLRLEDHMLRDIGFDRCHAEEMAARSFWRT